MTNVEADVFIHPTAVVAASAVIGPGTRVWNWAQVRERARVGAECVVGKGAYIDSNVQVGSRVKIQNGASLFQGVTVEDGVFIGPHACFTNDKVPRAINPDGSAKGADDWTVTPTLVRYGASVGAGAVIVCGIVVGRFAMIAAGAVVTHDIADHGLVVGTPARLIGYVCACGQRLPLEPLPAGDERALRCATCGFELTLRG